ncbi:Ras family protein [Histomonas meleagridis]|uniref:Ras family protein n=1 Tax=Histomonas meleagridis TaxID=135588 RepID=UPI003559EBBB|nr:Ras family protein [Histomonas meleagridis]KAH0798450.1 Ras family protein [Histomonas meleagridis]
MEDDEGETTQKIVKIIVVGDMGTGKTSMIRKFVDGNFSEFYKITIGVDFASKTIQAENGSNANVQLWDIAGQERFGNMTSVYYREAIGALVVFDVKRSATFDMTKIWKKDIDEKVQTSEGKPIPTLLIGNKIDLITSSDNWPTKKREIEEYAKENNFLDYFETSAKEGTNLDEAIYSLVNYIVNNNIESENSRDLNPGVDISETSRPQQNNTCCK